jgi:hypothetical protein
MAADIIRKIERTKSSKRNAIAVVLAALRTVCSKSDILKLQKDLDSCRAQLHLQLSMTQRWELLPPCFSPISAADKLL